MTTSSSEKKTEKSKTVKRTVSTAKEKAKSTSVAKQVAKPVAKATTTSKTTVVVRQGATATKSKVAQKVRIKLKAFDYRVLDQSSEKIVGTAQRSGAKVIGPVPLPTDKNVWCVLKSPHVNKRGGEHFEIRTHKRLIDIINPPASTIDALMQLDLPAGVDIEIKLG